MLDRVGIPQPDRRVDDYPHQFSGGMRQRAMIAMALINNPDLLIADEPTTALDVTVQAQILDLLQDLQREFDSAIIIITHDLGVVAEMADDVLVMYAGRAVEYGRVQGDPHAPGDALHLGLLSSVPDVTGDTNARLIPIPGNPPSLLNPPSGCPFHPRCAHRDKVPGDLCRTVAPELAAREPAARDTSRRATWRTPTRSTRGDPAGDRPRPGRGAVMDAARRAPSSPPATGAARERVDRASTTERRSFEPHAAVGEPRGRQADPAGRGPAQVLPGQVRGPHPAHGRPGAGGRRHLLRGPRGRLAGPGRRVRLRQVDDRPADHPAATSRPAGRSRSTARTSPRSARGS